MGGPLPSPRPNSTGRGAAPGLQEQPRPRCSSLTDLEKMVGRWKWCPGRTAAHLRTRGSPDALGSPRFLPVAHTCQGRGKASRRKKELTDPQRPGVKEEGGSAKGAGLGVDSAQGHRLRCQPGPALPGCQHPFLCPSPAHPCPGSTTLAPHTPAPALPLTTGPPSPQSGHLRTPTTLSLPPPGLAPPLRTPAPPCHALPCTPAPAPPWRPPTSAPPLHLPLCPCSTPLISSACPCPARPFHPGALEPPSDPTLAGSCLQGDTGCRVSGARPPSWTVPSLGKELLGV